MPSYNPSSSNENLDPAQLNPNLTQNINRDIMEGQTEQALDFKGDLASGLFELGYITIGTKKILVEEISISTSYDVQPRHVSDQVMALDLEPQKQKIEFTFKKPKVIENDILFFLATNYLPFQFDLFKIYETNGGKTYKPIRYLTLLQCQISKASFGNFDGTKPVTEEIQGVALYYTFNEKLSSYSWSILDNFQEEY
jgi:hypothetical protein